jgi:hypothetical protein
MFLGNMPTTNMLLPAYLNIQTEVYTDRQTGEVVMRASDVGSNQPVTKDLRKEIVPDGRSYAIMGHSVIVMALSCAGGCFAIYVRSTDRVG